jgi:hypothetical protein
LDFLLADQEGDLDGGFPDSYSSAREVFRRLAIERGWELSSYPITARGPGGDELTIDVAVRPAKTARTALVVSSGVHGVEGRVGSAVQLELLRRWTGDAVGERDPRLVFIHAVNPYGYAWDRRFNEENIDLNRNMLVGDEAFAGCPADYPALDALLNPQRPPSPREPFLFKALWAIARKGMPALKQAIAGGQYEYPQGLFFGGRGPSESNDLIDAGMPAWLGGAEQVVHLDFHTGLGESGRCQLLMDTPPTEVQRKRLVDWFGPESFQISESTGVAYEARGGWGRWCVMRRLARDYLFACAEFGTFGPIAVLGGLRSENQAHHWAVGNAVLLAKARARLRSLFCPEDSGWRREVLGRGVELAEAGRRGLAALT